MTDKDSFILKVIIVKVLPAFFLSLLIHSLSRLPIGSSLTNVVELKTAIIPALVIIIIIKYITKVLWQAIETRSERDLVSIFQRQVIVCIAMLLIDIYLSVKQ